MLVREIVDLLECQICCGGDKLDTNVNSACGADMMSDVLAFVKDHAVLLTGLVNMQVVRTAEMMDIDCIVFVRGKEPEEEVIERAKEMNIILLKTKHRLYTACGRLYKSGLRGGECIE